MHLYINTKNKNINYLHIIEWKYLYIKVMHRGENAKCL